MNKRERPMQIEGHAEKSAGQREVFEYNSSKLEMFLNGARLEGSGQEGRLSMLTGMAKSCARFGSLFEPDAPSVAKAIRICAEANAALIVAAWLGDPPRFYRLGDGPPVSYTDERPTDSAHAGHWMDGFDLAMISRQHDLLDLLTAVSTEALRQSPTTSSPEVTFRTVDLRRALWTTRQVTADPSYAWQCQFVAECTSRSLLHRANRALGRPYLALFPLLEQGNEAGFVAALTEAIVQHKQFYSSTDKLRNEPEGFVSLKLTAMAALAWDRGMRFDVESDYTPRSWVTGELFRR